MYKNGIGREKDLYEAKKWYLKSAEEGYTPAYISLGLMYEDGHGVWKNLNEAKKWYEWAAKNGSKHADKRLKILSQAENN